MTIRVVVATPAGEMAVQAAGLVAETPQLQIAATLHDPGALKDLLRDGDVDVVLLHEDLGPLPAIDLARQLSASFPDAGLVLLVREETTELLRAALTAGVRAVLPLPPSPQTLEAAIREAAGWSRSVRQRLNGAPVPAGAGAAGCAVVVVSGAKGGVGTSTVAVHLALAAADGRPAGSACLVDMDLQCGDLRLMLDLPHRRSIVDLVGLGDELSSRQIDETVHAHGSGLHVLLAPELGEQGEDVTAVVSRQVLGALRLRHEVVVVDVGAVLTPAAALAIELADQVLVVTTPDVLSLRAANRAHGLWERLQFRESGVMAVINRASRGSEIQPDMVRRTLELPVAETVLPASFRALEPSLNTGTPERLQGPLADALDDLARELLLLAPDAPRRERRRRRFNVRGLARNESGQAAIETAALMLIVAICLLGVWQMVLVGYTYVASGHAAREGSRALAVGEDADAVRRIAAEDVRGGWRDGMRITVRRDEAEVSVRLTVPALLPGGPGTFAIQSTEGTVIEDRPLDDRDR